MLLSVVIMPNLICATMVSVRTFSQLDTATPYIKYFPPQLHKDPSKLFFIRSY